ncbi:hypothetical protein EV714DRAFT_206025 [Schizophyllum commune]
MTEAAFPFTIRRVVYPTEEETVAIIDVMTEAFKTDPGSVLGFGSYLDVVIRPRNEYIVRAVLKTGEVYVCEDPKTNRIAAVATWLPPGKEAYETEAESQAAWNAIKVFFPEKERRWLEEYVAGTHQLVVDSIGPNAERDEWYLQRIGVHPDFRAQGIATQMIKEQLKKDPSVSVGWLTVVMLTDPHSVALQCTENMWRPKVEYYRRLGWEVKGEQSYTTLGGDITLYVMLRPPSKG